MVKCQKALVDVIREAEYKLPVHQPLPTHTRDGAQIRYKPVCYFHLFDPDLVKAYGPMFVHLDDRVFRQEFIVDVPQEDTDHGKRILRYGICRSCAEVRKLIPVDENGEVYLS